jgi:hypothetical protein
MANEKRLICAYVLAKKVHESKHQNPHDDPKVARNHMFEHDHFLKMIYLSPTVDAVEVVRCKDCKRYSQSGLCNLYLNISPEMKPNDFCSYGERK